MQDFDDPYFITAMILILILIAALYGAISDGCSPRKVTCYDKLGNEEACDANR